MSRFSYAACAWPGMMVLGLVATMSSQANGQTFDFSDGIQGWRVYNISAFGNHISPRASVAVPTWDTARGNPAPCLQVGDLTGDTWIGPPATVYGPRPELFGTTLAFDIQYRFRDETTYASICIESPAMSLYISELPPALGVWLHREYVVEPGLWRVNSINGVVATEQQIRDVIGNLTGLYIYTEWRTGPDDTSVDNVVIGGFCSSCCIADFNGSGGTPDDADVAAFFLAWSNGETTADVNGSGGTPDDADVAYFFERWDSGC